MGTQQLLMIVLGVIIVGVAIVVGINMFSEGAVNAEADRLVQEVNMVASNAAAYYRKPVQMGGGGRSFTGITADSTGLAKLNVSSNDATTWEVSQAGTASSFKIKATGTSEGVVVEATIGPDGVVGSPTVTKP